MAYFPLEYNNYGYTYWGINFYDLSAVQITIGLLYPCVDPTDNILEVFWELSDTCTRDMSRQETEHVFLNCFWQGLVIVLLLRLFR